MTGAMTYNYSFNLPSARGRPQPTLALSYNSSTRDREAGYGWGLNLPVIERKPLSGNPCFKDDGTPIVCGEYRGDASSHLSNEDHRYTFNGQPLVLICRLPGAQTPTDPHCGDDEKPHWKHVPDWGAAGNGWLYFRLQVEGQFARFYLSKDRKYWRVQLKGGEVLEFGDSSGYGVEHVSNNKNAILRWRLVRHLDELHSAYQLPNFSRIPHYIEYRWKKLGKRGLLYLTDIFDTQRAGELGNDLSFAHHTQLTWGFPDFPQTFYADPFKATPDLRLTRVSVASMPWSGIGPREVIRSYWLHYAPSQGSTKFNSISGGFQLWQHSFLKEIRQEGRCGQFEDENGDIPLKRCQSLEDAKRGLNADKVLPPTTFEYKEVGISFGAASLTSVQGRPPKPFNDKIVFPYNQSIGIVDFNMDGLPDFIQSWNTQICTNFEDLKARAPITIGYRDQFYCNYIESSLGATIQLASQSTRPITGYLNEGISPGERRVKLQYQCMDAGRADDPTGLTYFNLGRPPGFFSNNRGATLVGQWGEGVVAWSNAQFAPYKAKELDLSMVWITIAGIDFLDEPQVLQWEGGLGCDPEHFVESQFYPRWKWEKVHDLDWAKLSLSDPDFTSDAVQYGASPPRWYVDIDGDGLTDRLSRTGERGADLERASVSFTQRYAKNVPLPGGGSGPAQIPFAVDLYNSVSSLAPTAIPWRKPFFCVDNLLVPREEDIPDLGVPEGYIRCEFPTHFFYVDINGDGLIDLVTYNPANSVPHVRPGNGKGNFGCEDTMQPWPCLIVDDRNFTTAYAIEFHGSPTDTKIDRELYFRDVTGDGLADIVEFDKDTGNVFLWVNQDGRTFACVTKNCLAGVVIDELTGTFEMGKYGPNGYRLTFADMTADGIDDLVVLTPSGAYVGSFVTANTSDPWTSNHDRGDAPRPGLLIRVHNGYGATTDIQYHTIQQLDLVARGTKAAWEYHSPVVANVVTKVVTRDTYSAGVENVKRMERPFLFRYVTQYFYRDPAYDRWSQSFVGFRRVGVQQGDEKAVTTTTYWFGPCQNNHGRGEGDAEAPLCPKGSDDDDHKSLSGRPIRIDRGSLDLWFEGFVLDDWSKATGIPHVKETKLLWTKMFDYNTHFLFQKSDRDRRVTFSYPAQTHTYLYDDAQPAFHDGEQSRQLAGGDKKENPWRQPNIRKHLRSSVEYDDLGNVRKITNDGSIIDEDSRAGAEADPVSITLFSGQDSSTPDGPSRPDYTGVMPCNANWQCRPEFITVWDPKAPSFPLRKMRYNYNGSGDIVSVEGWLEEANFLQRSHAKPGALFAKDAPGQSLKQGWHMLTQLDYDISGNIIFIVGGVSTDNRPLSCTTYEYDDFYRHLPRKTSRFNNGCGGQSLVTQNIFDRGFQQVVKSIAPNHHFQEITLDPFGRPLQIFLPNPDAALDTEPLLSATITYKDSSPLNFGSLNYVDIRRMVGPSIETRSVMVLNGLHRPVLNFDLEAGDKWSLSGWEQRNAADKVINTRRSWLFFGDPTRVATQAISPQVPQENVSFEHRYDDFGRAVSLWKAGGATSHELLRKAYFPLATETRDAEQLKAGPHGSAFARSEIDGFGRTKRNLAHVEYPHLENVITEVEYSPAGEPKAISRIHAGGTYQRTMRYDTLGRLVLNMEPNTGNNWRYVWDGAGRLVGTSDARGCGVNLYYDGLGRVRGKDYSPCLPSHVAYTVPNLGTGAGLEAFYQYDTYETGQVSPEVGFNDNPNYALGNLVAVRDRGSHTRFNYDARDRVRRISRQIANPEGINSNSPYAPHWFISRMDYELDDQLARRTTGVDIEDFLMNGTSEERYSYLPNRRLLGIDSSYGTIVKEMSYDVEAAPTRIIYGDKTGTTQTFAYDEWRRLSRHKLSNPLSPFSGSFFEKWASIGHFDYRYSYDDAGNPLSILDESHRFSFQGLPSNAKPVLRRNMKYDDHYRLTSIDYSYRDSSNINWDGASSPWQSPFEAETKANDRRPIPQRELSSRIGQQTFQYDGMGNITGWEDDLKARFDRSLGTGLGYGTAQDGPNQLRTGEGLNVRYDPTGNLSELKIERPGKCLGGEGNKCAQWFLYDWNEVGQLVRARRWDFDGNKLPVADSPAGPSFGKPTWDISYSYSLESRVIKSATDAPGLTTHSLKIFDTFRIDRAAFNSIDGNYQVKPENVHVYMGGIGHAFWDDDTVPHQGPDSRVGMHLIIGDHLGSSSIAINHASSKLVELTTYQPYGAVENDYRPSIWKGFREPYKFTGKEEDIEVGVTYFGARYYQANLGRFMSADPRTVHGFGSDLNPYAYVKGRVASSTDPMGLEMVEVGCTGGEQACYEIIDAPSSDPPDRGAMASQPGTRQMISLVREHPQPTQYWLPTPPEQIETENTGEAASSAGGFRFPKRSTNRELLAKQIPTLAPRIHAAEREDMFYRTAPLLLMFTPGGQGKSVLTRTVALEEAELVRAATLGVEETIGVDMAWGARMRPAAIESTVTPRLTMSQGHALGNDLGSAGKTLVLGRYPGNVQYVRNNFGTYTIDRPWGWTPGYNAGAVRGHMDSGAEVFLTSQDFGGTFRLEMEQLLNPLFR
nr:RHS repeat-associated core domain-containing protein [Nitrosospira sp. Nl5]